MTMSSFEVYKLYLDCVIIENIKTCNRLLLCQTVVEVINSKSSCNRRIDGAKRSKSEREITFLSILATCSNVFSNLPTDQDRYHTHSELDLESELPEEVVECWD